MKIIIGSAISIGVIIAIVIYGMNFFQSELEPEPVIFGENLKFIFKFGQESCIAQPHCSVFTSGDGKFLHPSGIDIDNSGKIYVTDENNRVQVFDPSGQFLFKFGKEGSGDGEFGSTDDIAIDKSGRIYVADSVMSRVQVFDPSGQFLFKFGTGGSGDGEFIYTNGISVDDSGKIYVTDSEQNRVQVFDPSGQFLFKFGTGGSGDGEFETPYDTALDEFGRLYVVDVYNNRVQVFDPSGNFLIKFGYYCQIDNGLYCFDPDGLGPLEFGDGGFIYTHGIAVDNSRVYVLDYGNNRVQVYEWQESK